jgi:hypothetical protein
VVAPGEIKEHPPHNTRFPFAERNLADFLKFSAFFEKIKIKMPVIIRVFF